jgi:hypothetical protein
LWTFLAFPFQSKEKHLPTFRIMSGDSVADPSSCKNWNFKPPFSSFFFFFFFFFFSWCALGYNSIPTLVCGLRNPLAIIIIIITIISCLASSHHQELSLAREGVTVYWNENYLSNTYRIYIYYYRKWKGYYTLIMQSNFFNKYLIHLSLKNNSN